MFIHLAARSSKHTTSVDLNQVYEDKKPNHLRIQFIRDTHQMTGLLLQMYPINLN